MNNEKVFEGMFDFRTKHHEKINKSFIASYKKLYYELKAKQDSGELEVHEDYIGGSQLASDIFKKKYYLKDMEGNLLESKPEDIFRRLASYIASVETDKNKQSLFSKKFYNMLYQGYFMPGGRVIAGAGDLFRLKTLANCFVTVIKEDNIESIYNAAYDCARTYSYGGGIGVDITPLRPKDSIVHNAADKSTGAVSFMDLYSMTTGLIGQSGRRGALMITLDVKHPDVIDFIKVKQKSNWITNQIVDQCTWSGKFDDNQLSEIKKQVRENTQVRFANISLKVSDEFMNAVDETHKYKKGSLLLYKKLTKEKIYEAPQNEEIHYAFKIPSKKLSDYEFVKNFETLEELNSHINANITKEDLDDSHKRDLFGDYLVEDFAVHRCSDFMTYFGSENTEGTKEIVDVTEIWNAFVAGNYTTAEPGLIFWDSMSGYSPSDYLGKKISSTNPCFSADNFVTTKSGPKLIKDILNKKVELLVDDEIISSEGFFLTGTKKIYKVETEEGFKIKLTDNHKLRKVNNKILKWSEVKDLNKGDKLKLQYHKNYSWDGEGTFDEGFLLGMLIGDGTFSDDIARLSVWDDEELKKTVIEKIKPFMKRDSYEGWEDSFQKGKWNIKSQFLTDLATKYNVFSKEKEITKEIETASSNFQKGFLNGLFSADACVQHSEKKGYRYLRLNQSDLNRLEVVQRMLARFGIFSKIYLRREEEDKIFPNKPGTSYKTKKNYEVSISKTNLIQFAEMIGMEGYKKENLKEVINSYGVRGPYNENWEVTIKNIIKLGEEEVYDIQVPGENRLDVNGFDAHNCGEVPLEDGGACNLGSLNLSRFVIDGFSENAKLNWDGMKETIHDVVRFLDNVIEWNISLNALQKQRDAAKDTRRLGIGLMGISDMLNQLNIDYDSQEGVALVEKVTQFLTENCYTASANLAKEKAPLPIWNYEKYSRGPFFNERLSQEVQDLIKENGLRNIALTSIAPTGTISNIVLGYQNGNKNYLGVSGGIEPIFALYYTRRSEQMNEGAFYKVFHATVQAYIDKNNLQDQVKDIGNLDELRKILPKSFFRTSHFINADSRIKTQAACQKYIDHSISSTVNLPESVEPEAISDIYIQSWKEGLKGITIYRDGSRFPILSVEKEISEFQEFKEKTVTVVVEGKELTMKGDAVFKLPNGKLSTPFHARKQGFEVKMDTTESKDDDSDKPTEGGKSCKVEFVDGKLVKSCGD